MNKAFIILLIAVAIIALWTFNNSFISGSTTMTHVSGTSAIVVAKDNSVSIRVKFWVNPQPGYRANISFTDGTQKQIGWSYTFEVFLPSNGTHLGSYGDNAPAGMFLNNQKPVGVAFVSNPTGDFLTTAQSGIPDPVTVYSFEVQGNATVLVAWFGVAA